MRSRAVGAGYAAAGLRVSRRADNPNVGYIMSNPVSGLQISGFRGYPREAIDRVIECQWSARSLGGIETVRAVACPARSQVSALETNVMPLVRGACR